ncbi:MAG TPA: hypothetical protein VFY17_07015 [Pilimelia sp.]|nr:hypothetical protein [Pilimelia sp.]
MGERAAGTTAAVDQVWAEFHHAVNMPSEQLRGFRPTRAAGTR